MPLLKEHFSLGLPIGFDEDGFKAYLQGIWENRRYLFMDEDVENDEKLSRQQFLSFADGKVKASQYVGFIQYEDLRLIVYPKLFKYLEEEDAGLFYKHLIHWLSYCRRVTFPFHKVLAELALMPDLPEALIFYFSKRTLEAVQGYPYSQFEHVQEELSFIKGKLLTRDYIRNSMGTGNFHAFPCEHEPFIFNNKLNHIIKAVSRRLLNVCKFPETWYNLEQILFILEEVEDIPIVAEDCDHIRLNPMFVEYEDIVEMCRFFLAGEQLDTMYSRDNQISFLFPMNYLFEDYLCGFIEDKFSHRLKAKYQSIGWLTDQGVFQMRNDLVLLDSNGKVSLIIDTKYKVREDQSTPKRGISQSDMYQMISYAIRNNCNNVLLLYPSLSYSGDPPTMDRYTISSPMLEGQIEIYAVNVCINDSNVDRIEEKVYEQLEHILFTSGLMP